MAIPGKWDITLVLLCVSPFCCSRSSSLSDVPYTMQESLFFVVEAMTVLQWSRASDYVGRKPILLIGLVGTIASMLSFGFSTTFLGLVISRCLTGLLNGNVGVMKSAMGDLTDATNRAEGFALMPVTWAIGCTVSSACYMSSELQLIWSVWLARTIARRGFGASTRSLAECIPGKVLEHLRLSPPLHCYCQCGHCHLLPHARTLQGE